MLYRALRKQGHQVLLVSFKRQYPQRLFPGQSDKDPSLKPLKVEDAQYWIDSLNPLTWLASFWRICRYKPDLVVMQWWTSFLAPVWIVMGVLQRVFLRRQLVIICHNVLPHEKRWWDEALARLVLGLGTGLIVQSDNERNRLLALLSKARVTVVAHPVYDMFASEQISKEAARLQLGLPADAQVLLFFGIVREYKGLSDALEALPIIRTQLSDIRLVVAGEFWDDKQPYLDKIERLGIGERVMIHDHYIPNEQVPLYFSAADALVAPYRRATGSGAVQMARGFGLPVITTRAADDSDAEIQVPIGDVPALAAAIILCLRNPRAKQTKISEKDNSWERLVDSIRALSAFK